MNSVNRVNKKPKTLHRGLNKQRHCKKGKVISRIVAWIIIIIVIAMMSFMIAKDRLLNAGQWNQAKHSLSEWLGFQPDARVSLMYIPIADTAFLSPSHKWLKDYWQNPSRSEVNVIRFEVTPEVSPLDSQKRESKDGVFVSKDRIVIILSKNEKLDDIRNFPRVPNSFLTTDAPSMEEPSDQKNQGLRRFRRLLDGEEYISDETRKEAERSGKKFALNKNGKYYSILENKVDYILIKEHHVKYFITCDDVGDITKEWCHLHFPWGENIMTEIVFTREILPRAVAIADAVKERLHEFEINGKAYQKALPESEEPHATWAWSNRRGELHNFRVDELKESEFDRWLNEL